MAPPKRQPADSRFKAWSAIRTASRGCLAVASALSFVFCGCRQADSAAPLRGADVVLIVVDTLRADHLGFAGYALPTSPFLDRLAAESTVFTDALAPSSYTRESVAGLFTGMWPACSGAIGWNAAPEQVATTLAEELAQAGYETVMLTLTTMLQAPPFARGFARVEHLAKQWGVSRAGWQLTERALEIWREPRNRPLFLYLHYLDPHGPYDPPPEMLARFPERSEVVLDLYRDVRPKLPQLRAAGFDRSDPRLQEMVRRYDAEIAHTDQALEQLFAGLRASQRRPLLVVVTADHGEEFLEHGFVEHAWTLYEESVRVPLLWWSPGRLPPQRSSAPASLVDIFPTIRALVGIAPTPARGQVQGAVLFALDRGRLRVAEMANRQRWAELGITERNVVRALWWQGWKYVVARRWLDPDQRSHSSKIEEQLRSTGNTPPLPPAGAEVREELFHLASDPLEQRNSISDAGEVLAGLRTHARDQEERCPLAGTRPKAPVTLAPHEAEALRQLGY
ncbi:MAG: sulfatase [Candidatus Binatia bacterium]|nr:sulfatase [Candidatus Binatia bacterium]